VNIFKILDDSKPKLSKVRMSVQHYMVEDDIDEEPDDIVIPEECIGYGKPNKEFKRYSSKTRLSNTGFISVGFW
jgi:hypothetical protein